MHAANALRIVSVIVVAKAVLTGLVSWRRTQIVGLSAHIGADSWIGLVAVVATGIGIAAAVYVAARHYNGDRTS